MADRVSARPGDVLAEEGSAGNQFFIIDRGEATVTIGGKSIAKLSSGDFFGEMALLDEQPRAATVTASTPMVLYAIQDADFARLLDESPALVRRILARVAERVRAAQNAPTYASRY